MTVKQDCKSYKQSVSQVSQGGGRDFEPKAVQWGLADQVGAMNFAFAVVSALFAREKTGEGQKVTTSQLGAMVSLQAISLQPYLHSKEQKNDGKAPFTNSANLSYYKASDAWFTAAPVTQKFFVRFADAIGRPDLKDNEKCNTGRARGVNAGWYRDLLLEHFSHKPRQHWINALVSADIPCGIVHDYESLIADEQVWANKYIEKMPGTRWGPDHVVIGSPIQMSKTTVQIPQRAAPLVSEHETEVLSSVGYSVEDLVQLRNSGVLLQESAKARL